MISDRTGKISFLILLLFVCITSLLMAQNREQFDDRTYGAGKLIIQDESYFSKPIQIIDMPTASILRGGSFRAATRMYENGGLLATLSAGISNKVMFGVSFGGLDIIGNAQKITWNPMPGVHFVYRAFEESMRMPAIVIGFDSQGYGPYYPESKEPVFSDSTRSYFAPPTYPDYQNMHQRYHFKSRGFYCAVSKGYASFINTGLHAGVSYSIEKGEGEKLIPTIFMGADIHFIRDVALLIEYDFALDDADYYPRGLLNMGIRWAFGRNMFFDFDLQNMLGSLEGNKTDYRRIIKLTYYGSIL